MKTYCFTPIILSLWRFRAFANKVSKPRIFVGEDMGSQIKIRRPEWSRSSGSGAFSLVETLVVLAIMTVVAAFVVPSMRTILFGSALTQSGQLMTDQLVLAQQKALSTNHTIEVRFYQFGDPTMPGETIANPASGKFRAVQIFDVTAGEIPLTKVLRIPNTVVIDPTLTYSSLVGSATSASSVPQMTTGATETTPSGTSGVPIPQAGTNYNVVAFQFTPGGATNLLATGAWFLTLRGAHDTSTPPRNFVTIQIDPTNGHIEDFRP